MEENKLKYKKIAIILIICLSLIFGGFFTTISMNEFDSETIENQAIDIKTDAYEKSGSETLSGGQIYAWIFYDLSAGTTAYMWAQTDGPTKGITVFACDQTNYNKYVAGQPATVYILHEDMLYSIDHFTIPETKDWYFVFSNRDHIVSTSFDYFIDLGGNDIPYYPGHDWDTYCETLDPGEWFYVSNDYNAGDTIEGYFKNWINSDEIDFFICDQANYDIWSGGGTATVYNLKENYVSASWGSFVIPTGGTWYCVYNANDSPDSVTFSAYMDTGTINSITVTNPSSSSLWEKNGYYFINWDSTGYVSNVKIELYHYSSFIETISTSTPDDGSYYWEIPSSISPSYNYRIKITSKSDSGIYDYSDYFTISEFMTITVTSPTSSSSWETGDYHYIYWTSTGYISSVKIELFRYSNLITTISSSTSDDGAYYWSIPSSLTTSSNYRIKISSASDSNIYDYSDYFTISELLSITVTSPSSSSSWQKGSNHYIYWYSEGSISSVDIELYKGTSKYSTISTSTLDDGDYYWIIPTTLPSDTDYRIKIICTSDSGVYDYSSYFEISDATETTKINIIPAFNWEIIIFGLILIALTMYITRKKYKLSDN
ncbi:MAG: hypothetical protein EU549_00735, partial [Promethearchaeota archaeon]